MLKKVFLLFGLIILFSSNGYSKTNFYQVTGSISSIEVLKTYTTQKVPRDEKRCSIQRVPVNEEANKFGADNFIGALIGGAIGNRLGEGGGKSGSTAIGALIGSEIVRNEKAEAKQKKGKGRSKGKSKGKGKGIGKGKGKGKGRKARQMQSRIFEKWKNVKTNVRLFCVLIL